MTDDELHDWARKRARQLRTFYVHAGVYVIVILCLLLINAVTRDVPGNYMYGERMYHRSAGDWWFIWPLLGWGIVVAIHGILVAFGGAAAFDSWEDRKVEQLVRRKEEKPDSRTSA